MPRIDLIPEVYQDGENVYHYHFDNLPLRNIVARQEIINAAVDQQAQILRDAKGSASDLAARLGVSFEFDGSLKESAVDDILHNIGAHTDGEYDGIDYVRMKQSERDKLELIDDEAKNINIVVEDEILDGEVEFEDSDTIEWELVAPRTVKAHTTFGTNSLRIHYYDVEPTHADDEDPDYMNYLTTEAATAYAEGSLRIYINGIRISSSASVPVYGPDGPEGDWVAVTYIEDAANGSFELNRAIDSEDIIRIDFDTEVS